MIANFSVETIVVPIFHAKNPKPVDIKPRNNKASKFEVLNNSKFMGLEK